MGSRYFFIVLYCFLRRASGEEISELAANPRDAAPGMASVIPRDRHPLAVTRVGGYRALPGVGTWRCSSWRSILLLARVCFCIDVGGFVAAPPPCKLPILTASVLSFVTATLVNYLLCCGFVFRSGRFSRPEEIVRLFMIAFVGLGLNTAVVLLLAKILQFESDARENPCCLPCVRLELSWPTLDGVRRYPARC